MRAKALSQVDCRLHWHTGITPGLHQQTGSKAGPPAAGPPPQPLTGIIGSNVTGHCYLHSRGYREISQILLSACTFTYVMVIIKIKLTTAAAGAGHHGSARLAVGAARDLIEAGLEQPGKRRVVRRVQVWNLGVSRHFGCRAAGKFAG